MLKFIIYEASLSSSSYKNRSWKINGSKVATLCVGLFLALIKFAPGRRFRLSVVVSTTSTWRQRLGSVLL